MNVLPIEFFLKLFAKYGLLRTLVAVVLAAGVSLGAVYLGLRTMPWEGGQAPVASPATPVPTQDVTVLVGSCLAPLTTQARAIRDHYRADRFWVMVFQHDGSGEGSELGYRSFGFFSGICEVTTTRMGSVLNVFQDAPIALLDGAFNRAIREGVTRNPDTTIMEDSAASEIAAFRGAFAYYSVPMLDVDGEVIGMVGIDFAAPTNLEFEDLDFLVRQVAAMSAVVVKAFE